MPVRRCVLDGASLHSLNDLYDQLSQQLALPAHFGGNLDALWDCLSTDVEGWFEIIWKNADDSRRTMAQDYERVLKVFQELEKERRDFRLKIEP